MAVITQPDWVKDGYNVDLFLCDELGRPLRLDNPPTDSRLRFFLPPMPVERLRVYMKAYYLFMVNLNPTGSHRVSVSYFDPISDTYPILYQYSKYGFQEF